jgi:hypothetical protein
MGNILPSRKNTTEFELSNLEHVRNASIQTQRDIIRNYEEMKYLVKKVQIETNPNLKRQQKAKELADLQLELEQLEQNVENASEQELLDAIDHFQLDLEELQFEKDKQRMESKNLQDFDDVQSFYTQKPRTKFPHQRDYYHDFDEPQVFSTAKHVPKELDDNDLEQVSNSFQKFLGRKEMKTNLKVRKTQRKKNKQII